MHRTYGGELRAQPAIGTPSNIKVRQRARPARSSPRWRHPLIMRLSATLMPTRQGYGEKVLQPQEEEDRQITSAAGGRDDLPGCVRHADQSRCRYGPVHGLGDVAHQLLPAPHPAPSRPPGSCEAQARRADGDSARRQRAVGVGGAGAVAKMYCDKDERTPSFRKAA
jgi:hypothetical protein